MKKLLLLFAAIPLLLKAAPTSSPLVNIITAHEWNWSDSADVKRVGAVLFLSNGTVKHPWSTLPAWRWDVLGDGIVISPAAGAGEGRQITISFNPERSEFRGMFPDGKNQVRGLRGRLLNGPAVSAAVKALPLTIGAGAETGSYGGMVLGKDWLARTTNVKLKELEEVEFFAKQAVGSAQAGKEPLPEYIVPPFKWLMALEDALKLLPPRAAQVPVKTFRNDCFPQNTLAIKCMQFAYFNDLDQSFNLVYFVTDAKQQLVSVQFKSTAKPLSPMRDGSLEALRAMHPPYPGYAPPPKDGAQGPYNDFFNEATPGANYQIRHSSDRSVTLVKLGKVHWYLPAPFARCLLDTVDHHRKEGLVK